MGDQDKVLTHAQNFEPHLSVGCHSLPKNGVFPLSFMLHLISPWIGDHMLKKSISNSFWTNFIKSFSYGINFQIHNHDLFEKAYWN